MCASLAIGAQVSDMYICICKCEFVCDYTCEWNVYGNVSMFACVYVYLILYLYLYLYKYLAFGGSLDRLERLQGEKKGVRLHYSRCDVPSGRRKV